MEEWNTKALWKKVRLQKLTSVILIFLGINLMQLLAYIICVGIYIVSGIFDGRSVMENTSLLTQYMTSSDSDILIQMSAISALLSLIWCSILYYRSDWRVRPFPYRRVFNGKMVAAIITCGFGSCVILQVVLTILVTLVPKAFTDYLSVMSNLSDTGSWFTMFYLLILGPVSEEFIFRGAIMDRLKIAFPFWLANLLQAGLFGLYHGNLVQGLYAFGLGALLGLAGEVTGSILATIVMHITFNGTNICMGLAFPGKSNQEMYGVAAVFAAAAILIFFGIKYLILQYRHKILEENEKE